MIKCGKNHTGWETITHLKLRLQGTSGDWLRQSPCLKHRHLQQVAQGHVQFCFGISQEKDIYYHQKTVSIFLQKKYNYKQITFKNKILTGVFQEKLYCTFIVINVYKYWLVLTKGTKWHHVFMWMKRNITKGRCEGEFRIYGDLITYKSEVFINTMETYLIQQNNSWLKLVLQQWSDYHSKYIFFS